jgi:hypothetical protein
MITISPPEGYVRSKMIDDYYHHPDSQHFTVDIRVYHYGINYCIDGRWDSCTLSQYNDMKVLLECV